MTDELDNIASRHRFKGSFDANGSEVPGPEVTPPRDPNEMLPLQMADKWWIALVTVFVVSLYIAAICWVRYG